MAMNVGGLDRGLRVVVGTALVGMAVAGIGLPWTWAGVVVLVTGTIGWCPAYLPFGLSSCSLKK